MPKKPVLNWVTGWSGAFATSVTLDKVINSFLASVFLPIKLKKHFCITGIKKLPNAYWLKTTETYSLTVHETKSPKSRCWQSWFHLRPLREGSSPGLSSWLISDHPFLVSSHCLSCLCVQVSQFYKDTSHFGLGSTLMTILQFAHLCKDPLSK